MKCQKCGTDYYVDDLTASPFCNTCRKEYQETKNKTLETISTEHLQDWQSNAFDEHTKVCTEQRNAILNCWELLETPPEKKAFPCCLNQKEINENLNDILNKLRDILDPVVQKIYEEGDSDEKN